MKKFALYTAIFGYLIRYKIPNISIPEVDRYCYTDLDISRNPEQWKRMDGRYKIRKVNLDHLPSVKRNRLIKICIPDEIFDNYEYSVYTDWKCPTIIDFNWLLNSIKPDSDFLVRQHRERNCIYDEALACIEKEKDVEEIIIVQMNSYRNEKYPAHNGLYAAYTLFRRHTKRLKEFSRLWWEQVEKYSSRDQISLPYVAWKYGMKISVYERYKGELRCL